jgi:hypothetical protein
VTLRTIANGSPSRMLTTVSTTVSQSPLASAGRYSTANAAASKNPASAGIVPPSAATASGSITGFPRGTTGAPSRSFVHRKRSHPQKTANATVTAGPP